jgi:uncharacterized membrane protein
MGRTGTRWAVLGLLVVGAAGVAVARRPGRRKASIPVRHGDEYLAVRSVTVDRPAGALLSVWRDPDWLAVALARPVRLERMAQGRWRCVVGDPRHAGGPFEATGPTVEITEEASQTLHWRTDDGRVAHRATVTLTPAPRDRGTQIRVELRYRVGRVGHAMAVLRGVDADQTLRTVLRRVKSLTECGQVASTMDEPSGRGPVGERVTRSVRRRLAVGGRP